MLEAARYVLSSSRAALEEAARRVPGWPLLLAGHSLGGEARGVASVLVQWAGARLGLVGLCSPDLQLATTRLVGKLPLHSWGEQAGNHRPAARCLRQWPRSVRACARGVVGKAAPAHHCCVQGAWRPW